MYLFKNYDLKDWVSFAEVYGLPLRLGKYAPGASEANESSRLSQKNRFWCRDLIWVTTTCPSS